MTETRCEDEGIAVGIYCQYFLHKFNLRKDKLSFRVRMYLTSIYEELNLKLSVDQDMYIQNYEREKNVITFTIFEPGKFGKLSTCISMWSSHNIPFPKFPFVVFISMDGEPCC